MQATACAVDIVAKYSGNVDAFNEADNIFEGIESCDAQLFEDESVFSAGGGSNSVLYDESLVDTVSIDTSKGDTIDIFLGDSIELFSGMILPLMIKDSYSCGGNTYDVDLTDFNLGNSQIYVSVSGGVSVSEVALVTVGNSLSYDDIKVTMTRYTPAEFASENDVATIYVECTA